jgi:hypothetical protein
VLPFAEILAACELDELVFELPAFGAGGGEVGELGEAGLGEFALWEEVGAGGEGFYVGWFLGGCYMAVLEQFYRS